MSNVKGPSDLHKRLDDLEQRIAKKKAELARSGDIPAHHEAHLEDVYAKARKVRAKLFASDESTWDAVKDELESDYLAVAAHFEDWVNRLDEDYRHRRG